MGNIMVLLMKYNPKRAVWVWSCEVNGGWHDSSFHRQQATNHLRRTAGSIEMTIGSLRRSNGDLRRFCFKYLCNGMCFHTITQLCSTTLCENEVYLARCNPCNLHRFAHRSYQTSMSRWIGISGHRITKQFAIDVCSPLSCMLQFFEDQD